jgi:hypothetical protein
VRQVPQAPVVSPEESLESVKSARAAGEPVERQTALRGPVLPVPLPVPAVPFAQEAQAAQFAPEAQQAQEAVPFARETGESRWPNEPPAP